MVEFGQRVVSDDVPVEERVAVFDNDSTLWMSGDTQVISWINTKVWDETHDAKKATGWCPSRNPRK